MPQPITPWEEIPNERLHGSDWPVNMSWLLIGLIQPLVGSILPWMGGRELYRTGESEIRAEVASRQEAA